MLLPELLPITIECIAKLNHTNIEVNTIYMDIHTHIYIYIKLNNLKKNVSVLV